jgi:Mn-dependent DtxR family transcriptional regulator
MISKDLLTAKGTILGIVALESDENRTFDLETLTEEMGVASSTTRDRLESLQDAGLVNQSAEMVDGTPKRVFSLTEDGEELASHIVAILN